MTKKKEDAEGLFPPDEPLLQPTQEPPSSQWKGFLIPLAILIGLLVFWFFSSELFDVPVDVQHAYVTFEQSKSSYYNNPSYWSAKRKQLEESVKNDVLENNGMRASFLLQEMAPEVLFSIVKEELNIPIDDAKTFCIVPKAAGSSFIVLIAKVEKNIWPLQIVVSLEAEVQVTPTGLSILFTRLRRGSSELATGLTWAYFGSELEHVKSFPLTRVRASQGNDRALPQKGK